ncbi:type II and III secretion system protein family protein [Novosphingobium rosa]|uniref:type II and III secretion system protein family protein n=1 Tax=Novosphingobium rosa TaxID=76978 RepID=UPI00082A1166|nr:type II and III secretion system protein family protein [Novosphingobium rosa]
MVTDRTVSRRRARIAGLTALGFTVSLLPMAVMAAPAAVQTVVQQPSSGSVVSSAMLEVPLHKSQVVSADRPIARAMIGAEDIADIMPLNDHSVYVLGKKMGTTSLSFYDAQGRVISVLDVAVGPDVEGLKGQLASFIPDERIDARISNEAVVLSGTVNNPQSVDRAVQLARTYAGDKVVNLMSLGSSQQVMLEVRFAEVSHTVGKNVGVSSGATSNSGRFGAVTGEGAQLAPDANGIGQLGLSAITGAYGIIAQKFSIGGVTLQGYLNALESRGVVKTLAQPTLVALSGERASFLAGGEFPIPVAQSASLGTGSANSSAITVEFKQFGVSLGFTPTVLGDRTINLIVEPEVSQLDPTASITLNGISIPGLRTRRASTTLELRDGDSFAIAGLLQRDFKTTVDQMPLLGSIPILGALFRSTNFQRGDSELLIVVTAHLVAPIRAAQVHLPTDRVADPREFDSFLMGQPFHPNGQAPAAGASPTPGASAATNPAAKGDGYAY